jgi:Protein of unknown function (DUF1761)
MPWGASSADRLRVRASLSIGYYASLVGTDTSLEKDFAFTRLDNVQMVGFERHCSDGQSVRLRRRSSVDDNGSRISYRAFVVALAGAAAVSAIWYSPLLFGKPWMALRSLNSVGVADTAMPAWKMGFDLVRELVVIYVLARLVNGLGVVGWKGALNLGFWLWLGFPAEMLVGASLWDNKPWTLGLIDASDWLVKMLLMAIVVAKWPRVQMARLQTSSQ